MSEPLLSVIIPTYNRLGLLKTLLSNVFKTLNKCNFEYEVIVTDNASEDGTQQYFNEYKNPKLRYYRNSKNIGCSKNVLNGFSYATAPFVYGVLDDDNIGESEFFIEALSILQEEKADIVFGRLAKRTSPISEIIPLDRYSFKDFYTSKEYLDNWFNLVERISTACFIYKKDIILNAMISETNKDFLGGTTDYSIHYNVIKNVEKIAFVDYIAFVWTISQPTSISGEHRLDLLWQVMNTFAFPMANFSEKRNYDIDFFNKYILYATNAVLSSYCIGHNETYFEEVRNWLEKNKINKIFIFGRGEVGIMLNTYFQNNNIEVDSFIDDNICTSDCISYEHFKQKRIEGNVAVIVATYKCEVERKISRKFLENPISNVKVLSLFSLTQED